MYSDNYASRAIEMCARVPWRGQLLVVQALWSREEGGKAKVPRRMR